MSQRTSAEERAREHEFQFEGFENPTTTPVPDIVFDRFLSQLGEAELRALLYIIRRTFGFKRNDDPISFNLFLRGIQTRDGRVLDQGCGIRNRTTLSSALKSLERKGIIQSHKGIDEKGDNTTTVYCLRFKAKPAEPGVVREPYHRSTATVPPVVRQPYPQQTVLQETEQQQQTAVVAMAAPQSSSQPSGGAEPARNDLVNALVAFGITVSTAQRLSTNHPADYVAAKLDQAQFLIAAKSHQIRRNPAGYLRRAIEEDYAPPVGYKPKAQREAEENERSQQAQREVEERRRSEEQAKATRVLVEQAFKREHPPTSIPGSRLTTTTAWMRAQELLKKSLSTPNYALFVRNTLLLEVEGDKATIGASNVIALNHLETRLKVWVESALRDVLKRSVNVRFALMEVPRHGTPAPDSVRPKQGRAPKENISKPRGPASRSSFPRNVRGQNALTGA